MDTMDPANHGLGRLKVEPIRLIDPAWIIWTVPIIHLVTAIAAYAYASADLTTGTFRVIIGGAAVGLAAAVTSDRPARRVMRFTAPYAMIAIINAELYAAGQPLAANLIIVVATAICYLAIVRYEPAQLWKLCLSVGAMYWLILITCLQLAK